MDLIAGVALLLAGAWAWRREARIGQLLVATGVAWFAGDVWSVLVYAHRGPLVHLLLSYPSGRLKSRPAVAVTAAAYADGLVFALGDRDPLTIGLAVAVVAVAFWQGSTPVALLGASAIAAVLGLAAVARLAGADLGHAALYTYDAAITAVALGLCAHLRSATRAAVTGLVIDLGDAAGSLRAKLARALGDPGLVLGYDVAGGGYVDDEGRPITLQAGRAVTRIDGGVLVHDAAVLRDPELVGAVAAAARLAVTNARLQAEARTVVLDIEQSRRRIVGAGVAQRQRIQRELRDGAERSLDAAGARLHGELAAELRVARAELDRLAQGLDPLRSAGLGPALAELAARSAVPVTLDVMQTRVPAELELAMYFLCSEALANVGKHAGASQVRITVAESAEELIVTVADDGTGGADPARGSGLNGLADRIEAVGGELRIDSPPGGGTRLEAHIPLPR